jgi:general bacterial porin, GBP family
MKKHLIAAAVAAAVAVPAMAQDVQVYGILSSAYSVTKVNHDGETYKVTDSGLQGAQSGSRLGFRGTEDIGGGMKVGFVYELGANVESGLGANRLGYVDVSGGFGTIRLGRVDSLSRSIYNNFTANGNSGFAPGNVGSSLSLIVNTASLADSAIGCVRSEGNIDTDSTVSGAEIAGCTFVSDTLRHGQNRINNSIGYISPSFNGITAQIQFSDKAADLSSDDGKASAKALNLGLSYTAGPLAVAVARDVTKVSGEANRASTNNDDSLKSSLTMVGATYDFKVAKAFVTYTDKKVTGDSYNTSGDFAWDVNEDGGAKVKETQIGVRVPMGALELVASYSDGSVFTPDTTLGWDDKYDISAYQLQANYSLSKRTRLYAMFGSTKLKEEGGGDVTKQSGYALGVQHSF